MMKAKYLIPGLAAILIVSNGFAQTDADALRYSQYSIAGTARFSSMAGAFGALGGDFSSIPVNPAGLGIFRKSEFTFSHSFYMNQTKSLYLDNTTKENKFNFNIPNLGFVFTYRTNADKNDKPGWKNYSLGIGLNRINNFHTRSYFEGYNSDNSMLDHFVQVANNNGNPLSYDQLDPFYEQLAFDAGLIYNNPDSLLSDFYISDFPNRDTATAGITQKRTSTTRGGVSEWNIGFGANYNNMVYLGAALGISSLRYLEETTYEEADKADEINELNSFSFGQDLTTRGTGVNLNLGVIVRPAQWVRIGAALRTPTLYSMKDEYSGRMKSSLENYTLSPAESPSGIFEYTMATPMRATGSIAFIIGKMGLISADYEFVDYGGARFDASGTSFSEVNDGISEKYVSSGNIRLGGELRLENISVRGGYALYGSPFSSSEESSSGVERSRTSISGGIGIRDGDFFVDLGYVYTNGDEYLQPYSIDQMENPELGFAPGAKNEVVNHNFVVTLGVKF